MTEFLVLIVLFWLPAMLSITKKLFWDLYFWQIKEYRWDRFWTHIRWDQDDGNRNHTILVLKFILFSIVTLIFRAPEVAVVGVFLTYVLWIVESFEFGKDFLNRTTRVPSLKSPRNLLISILFFGTVFIVGGFITLPFAYIDRTSEEATFTTSEVLDFVVTEESDLVYPDIILLLAFTTLLLLFVDLALPFLLPFYVQLTRPISFFRRTIILYKARKKLAGLKNKPVIIGITGSQGKTTAKEILAFVLGEKYKVATTVENYNSDIGIGVSVLSEIKNNTEIFIAEMGAYKKGHIRKAVKFFKPNISVITDIDTQHIGLFGGQENLMHAKGEIAKYLDDDALAVLNGDNQYCRKLDSYISCRKIYVHSNDVTDIKEDARTQNIVVKEKRGTKNSTDFEIQFEDTKAEFAVPQDTDHLVNIYSIVVAVAKELGMSNAEIQKRFAKMNFKFPRLSYDTGDNDTVVLNDSYNSSRKGFIAAVGYMNKLKHDMKLGKRIVITKGIFELGREKFYMYEEIAKQVRDGIDVLITTDNLLAKALAKGNTDIQIFKVKNRIEMTYKYREISNPKDIILLEGRLHPSIIKEIISDEH